MISSDAFKGITAGLAVLATAFLMGEPAHGQDVRSVFFTYEPLTSFESAAVANMVEGTTGMFCQTVKVWEDRESNAVVIMCDGDGDRAALAIEGRIVENGLMGDVLRPLGDVVSVYPLGVDVVVNLIPN